MKDYARARGYFEEVLTTEGAGGVSLGAARRLLGEIYYFGNGVAQDYARARGYYEAVCQGNYKMSAFLSSFLPPLRHKNL